MKSHSYQSAPRPVNPPVRSSPTVAPITPFAFRTSCRRLLAGYFGCASPDHKVYGRRLRREAASAARRGDRGASAFLADLRHEQELMA